MQEIESLDFRSLKVGSNLNRASLDSPGEIVFLEVPNPEETQIWEGENEALRSHQH